MALSWEEFTATAGQTTVAVNVAYLDKADIHLEVNDTEVTGFTWASDTLITLPSTTTIAAGDKLAIIRKTDRTALRLLFSEGAAFTRDNIDEQNDQFLYLAQELVEGRSIDGFYGDISMNGYRITSLGNPEADGDAANKRYVDIEVAQAASDAASALSTEISRTVRISSGTLNPIRGTIKNKVLAFDSVGQPYGFTIASGSAAELAAELASPSADKGADLVYGAVKVLGDYSEKTYTITNRNQEIRKDGVSYFLNPEVDLPFTTTGTDKYSWAVDKLSLTPVGTKGGLEVTEGPTILKPNLVAQALFGKHQQGGIRVASGGVLQAFTQQDGVPNSDINTVPYVANTGNLITTDYGKFPEKQVWFPSTGYEDKYQSPSLGISYKADGSPLLSVITPAISGAGHLAWPNSASLGRSYKNVAFLSDVVNNPVYTGYYSDGTRYIQIAKWDLSSTPWNTEYKVMVTSSNTDDRFIGSLIVEANIQASGTTLKTQSNLTLANINKYFKARFDGPSDRIAYASGTVHSIPMMACSTDGTYLYLWIVQQSGASSTKVQEIHKGVGTALTTDYTLSNVSTVTPTGRMFIPTRPDYNGSNASASNDGHLLLADNHVRICNTSGSSTVRPDIEQGGFVWGGYGTYKSNRESCTITKSSTGTYVVTGPHISGGWTITQPRDKTGEQVAIAQISSSSDGNTNTITVYAIKYTYNSTTGVVTRGIGDLMDIPTSTWIDLHAATTF